MRNRIRISNILLERISNILLEKKVYASLLAPCTKTWDKFLAMTLMLCGLGKDGEKSREHLLFITQKRPAGRVEREQLAGLSQVAELARQKLMTDLCSRPLKLVSEKDSTKTCPCLNLHYFLELSYICKIYFQSKESSIHCTEQSVLGPSCLTSRILSSILQ